MCLERAGIVKWSGDPEAIPPEALLLYDSPDAVLASWRLHEASPPTLQQLHQGYKILLGLRNDRPPLASWRVAGLDPLQLNDWLKNQEALLPDPGLMPESELVAALFIRPLLQAEPKLLDCYLDLELKAELAGGAPDSNYLARLQLQLATQTEMSAEALLVAWWQPFTEAREEAELTLLQLHQVQEELEHYFLLSRRQQELLESHEQSELERLRLVEQQELLQQSLLNAREEAELTLLQLHQVQEELEHYFLLSRRQQELLESHEQLELRSERLLAGLINR